MRNDRDRLMDICEAADRVREKLPKAKADFIASDLLQVWVSWHLQMIGEAANTISAPFQKEHPEIPWKDIIAMRNLLVHQYFRIDVDELWSTAYDDLPRLRTQINRILKKG
jgi:uncharacterized protein with HEPN domain